VLKAAVFVVVSWSRSWASCGVGMMGSAMIEILVGGWGVRRARR
jgi:hypothetical protein